MVATMKTYSLARRTCVLLTLVLAMAATSPWAQTAAPAPERGNAPVEMSTPWGQRVVPTIDTYVDIRTYESLKPGQRWSEGDAAANRWRKDYDEGRLQLRRNPWRIGPGIYSVGPASLEQQVYLIDTGEGLLLIDPSLDKWHDELLGEIRQLGYAPEQVKWVIVTHCHIDHGQSCHLWRKRGARILVGEGDARAMETCNSIVATWVEPQANGRCTPCPVDERIHDGDVLRLGQLTLHAIRTPGHTPGSTSFAFRRDGKNVLISGDIALHNGRHAWMGNPYADWTQYLDALNKLAHFSLDGEPVRFDVLLPGHGTVDLDQAQRSITETIRVVRNIMARRSSGEPVEWIEPYPWNWEQGVRYERTR